MASIKVKFRPSSVAGQAGTIYYQVICERKVRQLISEHKVFPNEWDERRSMVNTSRTDNRHALLLTLREKILGDVERLTKIVRSLDNKGILYSADDIIENFHHYSHEFSLFNFMETTISRLKNNGKIRTAETYKSTLNSIRTFLSGEDLMLDRITTETMEAYEAWLIRKGNAPNTISFYTRILRAVYNRALELQVFEDRRPFRHVHTGVEKTVKRALPIQILRKIKVLDLTGKASLRYARDMFLLSFYLRGMSFIDMAYLRKSDLMNGYVTYRRRKTGQQLIIKWTPEMQYIVDNYPPNPTSYLLPIITDESINPRYRYRNMAYGINKSLKKIAGMVGITVPLTLYVARHSWASAAKTKGIPLSVISEGMGHDNETTTQIYLASLDTSVVDRANSIILKSLR